MAKAARIEHGGDKIACALCELSTTGAAIELANPASIHLDFAGAWIELQCRVIRAVNWRRI